MTTFVQSIGGGGNALLSLGSIAVRVFENQIAREIQKVIINHQNAIQRQQEYAAQLQLMERYQQSNIQDPAVREIIKARERLIRLSEAMTQEEMNQGKQLLDQLQSARDIELQWQNNIRRAEEYLRTILY